MEGDCDGENAESDCDGETDGKSASEGVVRVVGLPLYNGPTTQELGDGCSGELKPNAQSAIGYRSGLSDEPVGVRNLYSLFVDNISPITTRRRIREVFGKFGRVRSVFISRKRRRGSRNVFGFVRFQSKREAEEAMEKTNGMSIDDQVWFVKVPLFSQKPRNYCRGEKLGVVEVGGVLPVCIGVKPCVPCDPDGRDSSSYTQIVSGVGSEQDLKYVSEGIRNSTARNITMGSDKDFSYTSVLNSPGGKRIFGKAFNLEWLNRCAVAYVKIPNTERKIVDVLLREFKEIRNVCTLGKQQLLIEFVTSATRDEFISLGFWSDLFAHIKPWEAGVAVSERLVWLECSGIPIPSWSLCTFKEIADLWGSILCVYEDTIKFKNLCKAFIFISTNEKKIENVVDFVVDNQSFLVKIREVEEPGISDLFVKPCVEEVVGVSDAVSDVYVSAALSPGAVQIDSGAQNMFRFAIDDQAEDLADRGTVRIHCLSGGFNAEDELNSTQRCSAKVYEVSNEGLYVDVSEHESGKKGEHVVDIKCDSKSGYGITVCDVSNANGAPTVTGAQSIFGVDLLDAGKDYKEVTDSDVSNANGTSFVTGVQFITGVDPLSDGKGYKAPEACLDEAKGNEEGTVVDAHISVGLGDVSQEIPVSYVGANDAGEVGVGVVAPMVAKSKFVVTQEFINHSRGITADVLDGCRAVGIVISERDQRAITKVMTEKHIQAEIDFLNS